MLASVYGEDTQYAANRLSGTLVRSSDHKKLLYVQDVIHREKKVYCSVVTKDGATPESLMVELPLVDISPLPLGYSNVNTNAVFIHRQAARQYRQGTNFGNTVIENLPFRMRGDNRDWAVFYAPVFKDYPPLSEAFSMIEDVFKSVAISRSFKIKDDYTLHHRMRLCGRINPDNGRVTLDPNKEYLKELLLEETGLNV